MFDGTRTGMNQKAWYAITRDAAKNDEAEIMIYDEIGGDGVTALDFIRELNSIKAETITVRINSLGGGIQDGVAIFNALKRCAATILVEIDSFAASMASVIAMAGDEIRIAANAFMMIHNPWTITGGDSAQLRKSADILDMLKASLVRAYSVKTGMSSVEIQKMMDAETWMNADQAMALGFVDSITEPLAAAASVSQAEAKAMFDKFAGNMKRAKAQAEPEPEVPAVPVAPVEPPVVDPVIEPETEVPAEEIAPEPEVPATDPEAAPAEPVASIPENLRAMVESVAAIKAQNAALTAEIAGLKAAIAAHETAFAKALQDVARLEQTKGLAPAATVPPVEADGGKTDVLAVYASINDPAKRTEFFRANKAAILSARKG